MTRSKQTLLLAMTAALVGLAPVAVQAADSPAEAQKKIVFVHGKASHGYGGHAYGPAFRYLARILNEQVPAVTAKVIQDDKDHRDPRSEDNRNN